MKLKTSLLKTALLAVTLFMMTPVHAWEQNDYDYPQLVHRHIKVYEGYDFTISSHIFCYPSVSITLEKGATLYVEGDGVLENVILKPQTGSHIIIEDGCRIKHNKAVSLQIPIGVTLEQNYGTIE